MSRSKQEMKDAFLKLPEDEQWRFFIDGYRQNEGEGAFDVREPGYMAAMKTAFGTMLDTIDQPLTSDLIIQLHKDALSGVGATDNQNLDTFRNKWPGDFGLVSNQDPTNPALGNVSLEGIRQFVESGALDETVDGSNKKVKPKFEIIVDGEDVSRTHSPEEIHGLIQEKGGRFYCAHETAQSIQTTVDKVLDNYKNAINKAATDEEKLEAIIDMVSELERRHIFTDGNARTMVMLVLNRELVRNGFTPTVLDNPNRFDLFSRDELKKEISVGMQMFWQHATKGEIEKLLKQQEQLEAKPNKSIEMKQELMKIKEPDTVEPTNTFKNV